MCPLNVTLRRANASDAADSSSEYSQPPSTVRCISANSTLNLPHRDDAMSIGSAHSGEGIDVGRRGRHRSSQDCTAVACGCDDRFRANGRRFKMHAVAVWPIAMVVLMATLACNDGGPTPSATVEPPTLTPGRLCDRSYPTVCIAPYPPDLDCDQIPYRRFQVHRLDPHDFDRDRDGIGCEWN